MRLILFIILLLIINPLLSQERNFRLVKKPTENPTSQKRKAIVVGMSDYGQGRSLDNTINDANDMSTALAELGFEVTVLKNNDLRNLKNNLVNWYNTIQGNDMAIFYFAGHGVEVNGENYLIPIDADITSETDIIYNTLNVNSVLGNMDEKKVGMKLLILDACRDNPFKRSWSRSGSGAGLAQIAAPRGTYIAFAASPGFTAQDGGNFQLRNGVFTHFLKNEIRKKGISIDEIFNNVSGSVSELTGYKQTPFKNSSLTRTFYFIPPSPNSPNVPQPQEPLKKFYYYVDQNGAESKVQFSTREEAVSALRELKKFGKVYSNLGEIFIVEKLVENNIKPEEPRPYNPKPSNKPNIQINKSLKSIETNYLLNKIEDGKVQLDEIAINVDAVEFTSELWYWISKFNSAIFKNNLLRSKYPNAVNEANHAFQMLVQSDPSFTTVRQKGPEGFFDMYTTYFNLGLSSFNEKDYNAAANEFANAVLYSDYIFNNKWAASKQPFDTISILYCAYSYQNAQKKDEAVRYYGRLAESKASGEGFADVYKFLVDYYSQKKDKNSFEKYLKLGKMVYPNENWNQFEFSFIDNNYSLSDKIMIYEQKDAARLLDENDYLDYADIFINANKDKSLDSATIDKYTRKAIEAFKKAFEKNNNNAIAAFNVGITYYNYFVTEDEKYASNIKRLQELNGNKLVLKDPNKKAANDADFKAKTDAVKNENVAIEKKSMELTDIAAEWLTKSFTILKDKASRTNTEKSVVNKSVDFIANIYYYKMGRVRGKDAKLFDQYEAKYKEFDALHATFK